MVDTDRNFAGSIPDIYDAYLVPLIFEAYASDLARRAAETDPARVLETAAGTGNRVLPGTPLRGEIEARDAAGLDAATARAAEAIAAAFGKEAVSGKIQAHVFAA
jgi:hypothetical protein